MIDWSRPEKTNGRTRYPVTCPMCGGERLLTAQDARKAERNQSPCYLCSQKTKAKLGFRAMTRKYGYHWALRHVQAHQLAHPQQTAQTVAQRLTDLGIEYVPEYMLKTKASGRKKWVCLIDYMIVSRGQMWAVEVNGGVHNIPERQRCDRRKANLLRRRGIPLLVITAEQVISGEYIRILAQFITAQEISYVSAY